MGSGGRHCEVLSGSGRWQPLAFEALEPGMVFRLFEPAGQPVVDESGASRWRVVGLPTAGEDGRPTVEAEPIPETDAELAVRTEGAYWPEKLR